jgi:hypothetical protein
MKMAKVLSQSIGRGGYNTSVQDIQTIQSLLNKVPSPSGGPDPKLIVEGKNWGQNWDRTLQAIVQFQKAKFNGWADGRVDPEKYGGKTMAELNKYDQLLFYPLDPLQFPPDVPPVNPDPPASPKSNNFKIRMLGGLDGGEGIIADVLFFQIWDIENDLTAFYIYGGPGVGVSALPLSGTTKGPWNAFSTEDPVNAGIFIGPARFSSGGSGPLSWNYLHIPFVGGTNWGVYIRMDTGFTCGAGLSTSFGFLAMQPKEVMRFTLD